MRDFDVSKSLRTDLAQEKLEQLHEQNGRKISGLFSQNSRKNGFDIHTLRVSDKTGEAASGKKIGTYLTLDVGKIWLSEKERFRAAAETLAAISLRTRSSSGAPKTYSNRRPPKARMAFAAE